MRALLRAVAVTGLIAACGGGGGSAGDPGSPSPSPTPTPSPPPGPAGSASLTVTIAGLPASMALVRVDGPAGSAPRFVSSSTTLTGLPAGVYSIVPSDSLTGSNVQRAPTQVLDLGIGETGSATVTYSSAASFSLRLQEVLGTAAGLSAPTDLQAPAGDSRIFIAERPGRIRIVQGGTLLATPFLNISARVSTAGEGGLLSFAFHPQFGPTRPFVYVMYTTPSTGTDTDVVVERFELASGDGNQLQNPGLPVLRVPHPNFTNHNGGRVGFGPDGMLYVSLGDGGSAGDPNRHGQNAATLLGKLLRLDVSTLPYAIPSSNPQWTGVANARRENWAIGLRNPWRYAFDAPTGMLYIADVGQGEREEVNAVAASTGGLNFGWNVMEGTQCYNATSCDKSGLTLPILDYDHNQGCSITGGYVYRGSAIPELQGRYLYSDFCEGWLRSLRFDSGMLVERVQWLPSGTDRIQSFGVDGAGNLYMLASNGKVLRVVRN